MIFCMKERIELLSKELNDFSSNLLDEIEAKRISWIGKKGAITNLFEEFREVSPEEKRLLGKALNELKNQAEGKIKELKEQAGQLSVSAASEKLDLTRPALSHLKATRHPVSQVIGRITDIFRRVGFSLSVGPEIEDDWHNF